MKEEFNLSAIDEVYDNKTFRYRINGFAKACGMEKIDFVPYQGCISKQDGEHVYNIYSNHSIVDGYHITKLFGRYDNLEFGFINLIRKNGIPTASENIQLKYAITIKVKVNDYIYKLDIEPGTSIIDIVSDIFSSVDLWRFNFQINKVTKNGDFCNEVGFSSEINNFDKVLRIVEMFTRNPESLLEIYNDLVKSRKVFPNYKIVDRMINKDTEIREKVLEK